MAAELDALFRHPAQALERKHLKAAGVGEQVAGPGHEAVQPAELGDDVFAGPEVQVVGVAEDDLRAAAREVARRQAFHGALGADRHEARRVHHAVGQVPAAGARAAGFGDDLELKHGVQPAVTAIQTTRVISSFSMFGNGCGGVHG